MDMDLSELGFLNATVEGQPVTVALKNSVQAQLWSVVTFERTGDAARDPFRTATGFFDQTRATNFANAFKTTCGSFCVLLYHGTQLQQVVAGDTSLLELWRGRTGITSGAPELTEVADVTAEAVSSAPSAIDNGGAYVDTTVDTDPDASS